MIKKETILGRMYFDLPFCVKNVKSVKRVTQNVGNPLRSYFYAFRKVKIHTPLSIVILPS
jgi:hypothetical protein